MQPCISTVSRARTGRSDGCLPASGSEVGLLPTVSCFLPSALSTGRGAAYEVGRDCKSHRPALILLLQLRPQVSLSALGLCWCLGLSLSCNWVQPETPLGSPPPWFSQDPQKDIRVHWNIHWGFGEGEARLLGAPPGPSCACLTHFLMLKPGDGEGPWAFLCSPCPAGPPLFRLLLTWP